MSFDFDDLRMLLVVAAIGTVNTQEEPSMLLAAAHTEAAREGSSSLFVVQPDLNFMRGFRQGKNGLEKATGGNISCPWLFVIGQ